MSANGVGSNHKSLNYPFGSGKSRHPQPGLHGSLLRVLRFAPPTDSGPMGPSSCPQSENNPNAPAVLSMAMSGSQIGEPALPDT